MNKEDVFKRMREIKAERSGLREQLAEKMRELDERLEEISDVTALAERLRAIADMTSWAELDSGVSIKAGDRVRYIGKTYECTQAHTKALTRRPTDKMYWKEVVG